MLLLMKKIPSLTKKQIGIGIGIIIQNKTAAAATVTVFNTVTAAVADNPLLDDPALDNPMLDDPTQLLLQYQKTKMLIQNGIGFAIRNAGDATETAIAAEVYAERRR